MRREIIVTGKSSEFVSLLSCCLGLDAFHCIPMSEEDFSRENLKRLAPFAVLVTDVRHSTKTWSTLKHMHHDDLLDKVRIIGLSGDPDNGYKHDYPFADFLSTYPWTQSTLASSDETLVEQLEKTLKNNT